MYNYKAESIEKPGTGYRPSVDAARCVVFSCFVEQLLSHAGGGRRSLPLDFNIRVLERLTGIAMAGADRGLIRACLFGKAAPLPALDLGELAMCQVFQVMYEELCVLFGPVQTDLFVKSALSAARELPESALYSPARLM